MFELNPIILGMTLLILAAGFLFLILFLLRAVPRIQPLDEAPPPPTLDLNIPRHNEAVLLVQPGGRVGYLNELAREWFNLWEEEPNLERLARKARPSEAFLSLCASEGQARLSLNGRFVEGTSYFAPTPSGRAVLISLRRPQIVSVPNAARTNEAALAGQVDFSHQALNIITELGQAMASSLDLAQTIQAILEGVERLIPSDVSEITVWEADSSLPAGGRLIPYRFTGMAGVDRHLEKASEFYDASEGYSGYLATERKPLLISDVAAYREVRQMVNRQNFPIQSYLGVPLQVAGDLIGTLELASLSKESFSENDLDVLRILSGQAAVALHNSLLYQEEQQRVMELAGLANLAQVVSVLRDPQDLFSRLVESLSPLLPVEILGFLLYDENRRMLEGQVPFQGIYSGALAFYQIHIEPNSPAEAIWRSLEPIIANNGPEDPRLETLGLHHIALAANMRHTVLVPLAAGGRLLGFLQVANKRDGLPFDQDDLRLLKIITGQTAPMIENANLVQESRRRAQRAETLRRITSLTGSNATLEEILKYSILDLARLLQADMAAIFLLDESHGELRLHKGSLFGVSPEIATRLGRISIEDPNFPDTVTVNKIQFNEGDLSRSSAVLPIYRPLVEAINIRSAIDVPLIVRERGIGELMLGSFQPNFFSRGDLQTAVTAAGQLAAAVEQSALYSQTDQTLRQRVDQMTALTRISRELNTTLDLEHLLRRVYDELLRTTRANCGTILLFELNENRRANSSILPRITVYLGDPPAPELHLLEQVVLQQGDPVIIEDFSTGYELTDSFSGEKRRVDLQPAHAGINSALIVPIAYQGQVAGLIHLHASMPGQFDAAALEISETLAVQAAIALGNAHRYQEQMRRSEQLSRRVETLSKLFETSQALQAEQPLAESLESIAYAIQAATPFQVVLINVYNPQTAVLERAASAGVPLAAMAELRARTQVWSSLDKLLKPEFQVGQAYFIPYEKMPVKPAEIHTLTLLPLNGIAPTAEAWHPHDMLLLPLHSPSGQPLGSISVDAPRNNLRPDQATIETLEIFGSQAALAIENQQKLNALKGQIVSIQAELAQAQEAASAAQSHLPVLLHKDLEQTLAIQHLSQRARRINAGLDIAATVNRQTRREDVLLAMAREILTRMEFDLALIVEPTPGGPRLLHSLGAIPAGINPEALLGQRNPLRQGLQTGEILLVANLDEESEWQNSPLLNALEAKGFICLPVDSSSLTAGIDACVLAASRAPLAPFTAADEQLYSLLARQVSIALQNLNLLDETNRRLREVNLLMDFSSQLGSLDTESILQTLLESSLRVVPAARSAMVALWDAAQGLLVSRAALGYANNQRLLEIAYRPGEALPGQAFQQGQALRLDEVEFGKHYNLSPDNLLRYRDATGGQFPVSSLVIPIQVESEEAKRKTPLGVLVLDNPTVNAAFSAEDQALITSLTRQVALTLENANLYRSAELRAEQMQALTDVTATITSSLQPDDLIATLLDQLEAFLPYETGTLWLRQSEPAALGMGPTRTGGRMMVVRAARGFADSDQRVGLSVAVEDSVLLNEMIQTGQPISVANVQEDERFPSIMEYEFLSWLGVPLVASGEVIGVIALEKSEPNFYTPEHIQMVTTFAGQAAVALENATLYQDSVQRAAELDQRSQLLGMLNRLSGELSASLDARHILDYTITSILQVINCSAVSAVMFKETEAASTLEYLEGVEFESGQAILAGEYPPSGLEAGMTLPDTPLFERLRQTLGVFNTEDVTQEPELAPLADFLAHYNTCSLLVIPVATANTLHGLLLAHTEEPYRFEAEEVELARTIGNQAAIAVQNASLFAETRHLTEELEQRVEQRTAELGKEHWRAETLLRIITELSASLDLDQVLNRTLRVLNEVVDAEQITVMIARPGEKRLHRLASVGYATPQSSPSNPTPFNTDQGLAGWIITQRQPVLIDNVMEDARWIQLPDTSKQHRSALGVPLMSGAEALGALLLFHRKVKHFSNDQLDLVQAVANQVAVAVNNAELYRLIRDQAEDLGSMLRNQQVETSRSKAILEAVADGVLVTDATKQITLFNASAEKILNMSRSQVIGKSLEYFTGLFGRAARRWMETINTWSIDPSTYRPGDMFAEQIQLENGRVISVRLAPVSLRNDFLGTVSIFQDITHQVEVDRLKSEFVATVSHELRTPMTSIKGYVEILLMGATGSLTEQQIRFLQVVKANTERLTVLVNDLLDISRIEAGRATLSLQPLNLEELADDALADLARRSLEENRPVTLEKDIPANLPRVMGDLDRVRQIVDNLLDNAYHYNTTEGKITLRIRQVGEEIQIDVKDTGLGIPLEDQPRVFERFYRGENPLVLGVSGTGLGLSIVQNLVQMHHGRIWLESSGIPGEGSTFSFTLPVYAPTEG